MEEDFVNGTLSTKNPVIRYDNHTNGDKWTTVNHIWIYTSPLILIFGICGNILTIMVMKRQRMRGTSTSVYLTMLAAGDMTAVVVGLTPEWLSQLHIVDLWNLHPWVCKIELYLYYTSLDFAIWMLVAFSCDRFVAVCFPLKKSRFCTIRRALVTAAVVFGVANLNMHVFWTRGAAYNNKTQKIENCRYLPGYVHFEYTIRPPIVFVAAFLIPSVVIGIWNIMIILRITSAKDMRKKSVRSQNATRRLRKGLTQTTAMCVSTSVAFVVLVLPNIILFIGKKNWDSSDSYYIAKAISSQLVYIHHSINFVLYSLTGSRFRRELAFLCHCVAPSEYSGRIKNLSESSSLRKTRFSKLTSSVRSNNGFQNSPRNSPRSRRGRESHACGADIPLTTIIEQKHNDL